MSLREPFDLLEGSVPLEAVGDLPPHIAKLDEIVALMRERRIFFMAGGYTRLAREMFPVQPLPEGAMPIYTKAPRTEDLDDS